MIKVLIVRPSDDINKGVFTEMSVIPRIKEQLYFKGQSYSVSMVKYFMDADQIDNPLYKRHVPFVRLMLLNQ